MGGGREEWEGRRIEFKKRFRYQDLLLAPAAKSSRGIMNTNLDESEDCNEHHDFL